MSKELAKQDEKTRELALTGFEDEVGSGFEEADADCFAIPYLLILQKNSPQCDEDSGARLEAARPGMFFNNVTQELLDGEEGIEVVPVLLQHAFVEWVDRDSGGGFRGVYRASDPIVQEAKQHRDEKGRYLLDNGNYLADTIYFYALVRAAGGNWTPVVLSFTSTQLKKARAWNTQMQNFLMKRRDGSVGPAPMHSRIYRATTKPEQNEKGSWRGWRIVLDRPLDPVNNEDDRDVVLAARCFKKQVREGSAQIVEVSDDPNALGNEKTDF